VAIPQLMIWDFAGMASLLLATVAVKAAIIEPTRNANNKITMEITPLII
jgi:hypothetical protein